MNPNVLETAARATTRQGVCPIRLLDEYFTDHLVTEELCSAFVCAGCVADPEDIHGTWDQECADADDGAGTLDIPF